MREAKTFTIEDKLRAVEHLIEEHRWARDREDDQAHYLWRALKAIAADLRTDLPESTDAALRGVHHSVDAALRSRRKLGHVALRHQEALVEVVLHHWPVIRQKLKGD